MILKKKGAPYMPTKKEPTSSKQTTKKKTATKSSKDLPRKATSPTTKKEVAKKNVTEKTNFKTATKKSAKVIEKIKNQNNLKSSSKQKAWVIAADMGYGHQRAAYPLQAIAYDRIITANSDIMISLEEQKLWKRSQAFYEWVSRMTELPVIGKTIFKIYDRLQRISPFYPFRDLSKPDYNSLFIYRLIKKGLGKSIVDHIRASEHYIPIISTHPVASLIAEYHGLVDNFCVVTDSDICRAWVPINAKDSKIIYFAPTQHTADRLAQYGVPKHNIVFTGFPLPEENLGGPNLPILKEDLWNRLPNLDPKLIFSTHFKETILKALGKKSLKKESDHILTLMFAIGGAGAQKEIAAETIKSLAESVQNGKIRINLVTGIRYEVNNYILDCLKAAKLVNQIGKGILIVHASTKEEYFKAFNQALRTTDILWTKPSELCFYAALGIPLIIAPPVGAHEMYNQEWLLHNRLGIVQEDPRYTNEWLFDWLNDGRFAELAWKGFIQAPNQGTYKIKEIAVAMTKKFNFVEK